MMSAATQPPLAYEHRDLLLVSVGLIALLGLRIGEIHWSGAGLHVDEAQYWIWSRNLEWGYFSKPPLLAAMIRASTLLWGESVLGIRLLPMLCWIAASGLLWPLGRALGQARAGLIAAGLLAASPASGLLGLVATTDGPLMLGWVGTMLCAVKALQTGRLLWWAACGGLVGLSILAKYTAAALAMSLVVLPFFCPRPARRHAAWGLTIAGLAALLVVLPHLLWNLQHHWPTLHHTLEITVGQSTVAKAPARDGWNRIGHGLGRSFEFLAAQLLLLGPAAWLLGLLIFRGNRRTQPGHRAPAISPSSTGLAVHPQSIEQSRRWCLLFSVPLLVLVTLQAASSKAQINWAAPALAPLCLLLGLEACRRLITGRSVLACCACGLCFSALVALGGDFRQWTGKPAGPGQSEWDIWSRMKGWHETLSELDPAMAPYRHLPWVTVDRTIHAQVAFELKHRQPILRSWNPEGGIRHHFDWVSPLSRSDLPSEVLYIDRQVPDSALSALYPRLERLAAAGSGRVSLEVWRLTREQP